MPNFSPMATLRRSFSIQQSLSALEQRFQNLHLDADLDKLSALQAAQSEFLAALVVLDRECQDDAALREFARQHLSGVYRHLGLLWYSTSLSENVPGDAGVELSSILTTAFEAFGVPVDVINHHNFIGIHPSLDKTIVDYVIRYSVASSKLSTAYFDAYSEYQNDDELAFWRLHSLMSSLGSASSVECYLNVLDSLLFLNTHDPSSWKALPLIRLSLAFFNHPVVLSESDKTAIRDYFSTLLPKIENLNEFVDIHEQAIFMARSGLGDVAEPLIKSTYSCQRGHSQSTQLIDIETHTSLDVTPMLYRYVREHADTKKFSTDYFNTIVCYQLLSKRDDLQFDLIDYNERDHQRIESIVSNIRQNCFDSDQYQIREKNLRLLLQEYLAQHPRYLKELSEHPHFANLVKGMEIWDAHRLETDLGL